MNEHTIPSGISVSRRDEFSLNELIHAFASKKLFVFCVTAAFTLAALAASLLVHKRYQASIMVSAITDQMAGSGGLSTQIGGLAALVGIAPNSGKKSETLAFLQSEDLTQRYIKDNNLLPVLYDNLWDANEKRWRPTDPNKIPTLWKANRFFKGSIRRVTDEAKGGLTTVSITWTDPRLAAKWANDLVKLTNDTLRNKAIQESERHIVYLNEEAAKTNILEVKTAIYKLLESELKNAMVAKGNEEYALKVVDPAFVPERPAYPIPTLWVPLGFVAGFLFSIVSVLISAPNATLRGHTQI